MRRDADAPSKPTSLGHADGAQSTTKRNAHLRPRGRRKKTTAQGIAAANEDTSNVIGEAIIGLHTGYFEARGFWRVSCTDNLTFLFD